jgi:hypothetical protein
MSHHLQPIYDVWGGNAEAMAADIDELGVTVRQWRNRRDIPSRAWPKIIKAAAAKGGLLRLEDFLPPEAKSDLALHAGSSEPEWPIQSANNGAEIIRPDEEAGPGHPFSVTCSRTSTRPQVDARADQLGSNTPVSSPGASAMPPADAA